MESHNTLFRFCYYLLFLFDSFTLESRRRHHLINFTPFLFEFRLFGCICVCFLGWRFGDFLLQLRCFSFNDVYFLDGIVIGFRLFLGQDHLMHILIVFDKSINNILQQTTTSFIFILFLLNFLALVTIFLYLIFARRVLLYSLNSAISFNL